MAGNTRYHRLPEDLHPSMDSVREDERLIGPDGDNPTPAKNKEFGYSFHPTLFLRFLAGVLFLAASIQFILSQREFSIAAAVFNLIAVAREIWVLLHHFLTRYIRVRVRIELRGSRSSISTEPKKRVPSWLLLGFVQLIIDLLLLPFILGFCLAVRHHSQWYYGESLPAKILTLVALGFHVISAVDLGQPSKLICSGKFSFDTGKDDDGEFDDNASRSPVYRDVEATGAIGIEAQTRKTGADSPPVII